MPKKKRDRVDVEDIIARPWCYYCDRDFDDQKVLIEHQRAKHFHCPVNTCHRRLNTAGGLSVHLSQVHKETLSSIANALESRKGVEPEVFGMMGIPEELVEARRQRILNEFFKEEAEHRARTGNPPPGQKQGEPNSKKRKVETTEELKARAAEFRAKRAAEKQAAKEGKTVAQSASNAPDTAQGQGHTAMDSNPALPQNLQPSYDQMQSYGPQFQAPHHGLPLQSPLSAGVQSPFPVAQPGQWPPYSSPASFSPPQAAPYPPPPFMYPVHSPMTGQMPGSMMPNHNMRYAPNAPADRQTVTVAQTPLQPAPGLPARPSFEVPQPNRDVMQRMHTGQVPPSNVMAYQQHSAAPPHQYKLRLDTAADWKAVKAALQPADGGPVTNLYLQAILDAIKNEIKQKQAAEAQVPSSSISEVEQHRRAVKAALGQIDIPRGDFNAWLLDINNDYHEGKADDALNKEASDILNEAFAEHWAEKEANSPAFPEFQFPAPATCSKEKKKKKSKPDSSKMIYSDKHESPEEKMAKQSKYAYHFERKSPAFVKGEVGCAVTGVTVDEDTVRDVQH